MPIIPAVAPKGAARCRVSRFLDTLRLVVRSLHPSCEEHDGPRPGHSGTLRPSDCGIPRKHTIRDNQLTSCSALVQVTRTPARRPIHARRREASEKRQGTKSREVEAGRRSGLYGDLIAGGIMAVVDRAGPEQAGPTAWGRSETSGRGEKALKGGLARAERQG